MGLDFTEQDGFRNLKQNLHLTTKPRKENQKMKLLQTKPVEVSSFKEQFTAKQEVEETDYGNISQYRQLKVPY